MLHTPVEAQKGECMPKLHFTILIEGSAESVFALLADLAHYDRWLPGSKSFGTITQIAPLPVGLGTTYIDAGPAGTRHGEVTLHIHGLLKVAQPFVIAGFRQENERMLLALKRYVEKGT